MGERTREGGPMVVVMVMVGRHGGSLAPVWMKRRSVGQRVL